MQADQYDYDIPKHMGTLILADQVYQTTEGKWVIAGTYSTWQVHTPEGLHIPGLWFYFRMHTERPGRHLVRFNQSQVAGDDGLAENCDSTLLDLMVEPNQVPIFEGRLRIGSVHIPRPTGFPNDRILQTTLNFRLIAVDNETDSGTLIASSQMVVNMHPLPTEGDNDDAADASRSPGPPGSPEGT